MRDEGSPNLQSVARAIRALELIAEAGALGVTELGRLLDVHKATASRLIATLAERGLVERDPVSEKYRLGFGLDPPGRRGDGGPRPGPNRPPHLGEPGRAHTRDREPGRALG